MTDVKSGGYVLRLTVTLFAVTAVTALLLSLVNSVTKDKISGNAALNDALSQVMPVENAAFSKIAYTGSDAVVYEASSEGVPVGWCVVVESAGYKGPMSMVVGVDPDLSVSGVVIVSSSETIGLGTKTEDPEWLSQFIGKKAPIGVNSGDNHIDAVTGATVSSTTVTNGVNAALEVAAQVKGEKAK